VSDWQPKKGAHRRFTCTDCGLVVDEIWHGSGAGEFITKTSNNDFGIPDCPEAPSNRHPHAFTKEVLL
tara:strand:- start:185 stop:388 length:204 start_codon:yes stop_codon:yes gene_type:complete